MAFNWGTLLTGGIYQPGSKKGGQEFITPPEYTGASPYSAAEVGLGADVLSPLATQYLNQIKERSQGQGLVGFDPALSAKKKENFLIDLNDQQSLANQAMKAQSSKQGLRGGIPLSISETSNKNYENTRTKGLNDIDIADLEANREDRNTATYAQPQLVQEGAGIQQNKANFDLAKYTATLPTYLEPQQSNLLPSLIGAAGTLGGATIGAKSNSSLTSAYLKYLTGQGASAGPTPSYMPADYNYLQAAKRLF